MSKYNISGKEFSTKKQIEQYVRVIFNRTNVGGTLVGDDFDFVRELLNQHDNAIQKIGCGVALIRVDLNTQWKAWKMFVIVRRDGSETDFSYRSCIYKRTQQQDFYEACRNAVVCDILNFKRRYYIQYADEQNRILCPITGIKVGWYDSHIDHDTPWTFKDIADAFCRESGLSVSQVEFAGDDDGECKCVFKDSSLIDSFRKFHNRVANLRVVSVNGNLRSRRKVMMR